MSWFSQILLERTSPGKYGVGFTAMTRQRGVDLGTRTSAVDVEVDTSGTVRGAGYDVVPQRARLVAWWGG
jgi:hypothetical protein